MLTDRNFRALFKEPTLRLLDLLRSGPKTFAELESALSSYHFNVARKQIAKLRRDGVIDRVLESINPVRVQYALTPLGSDFASRASEIVRFVDENSADIQAARARNKQQRERTEVIEQ
jgi:DNA-binding HxlR family transcriptional regulator